MSFRRLTPTEASILFSVWRDDDLWDLNPMMSNEAFNLDFRLLTVSDSDSESDSTCNNSSIIIHLKKLSSVSWDREGRGVNHSLPCRAEVKERIELQIYSPVRAFMTCCRVKLHLFCKRTFFLITYSVLVMLPNMAVYIRN